MIADKNKTIVVTGATGLQGSAVTRHLLSNGWRVCALTRKPKSKKAQSLSELGAEVVKADMEDPNTLAPVFRGAYGVFSVQNPVISGVEGEVRQGRHVADAAQQAGVQHLVYSAAGPDVRGTGVPSWESKLAVIDHMKALGLPLTVIRPMAFMELMTEKKFFPAASIWQVMPRLMGSQKKVVWISVDDLGFIVAKIFADPNQYIGKELKLVSDVQSIDECREIYRAVKGKRPSRFPMPVWLFERFGFVGKDLTIMWRWLRDAAIDTDTSDTLRIHPGAMRVQEWLEKR